MYRYTSVRFGYDWFGLPGIFLQKGNWRLRGAQDLVSRLIMGMAVAMTWLTAFQTVLVLSTWPSKQYSPTIHAFAR